MEQPRDDGDDEEGLETGGELNFAPDVGELRQELHETREELERTKEELETLREDVRVMQDHEPAAEDVDDDEGLELGREA